MDCHLPLLGVSIVVLTASIAAQTVTGSGTAGNVPVFTGTGTSSTISGNSSISVSGSNVGINGTLSTTGANPVEVTTNLTYPSYGWDVVTPTVTDPSVSGEPIYAGYMSAPQVISDDANLRVVMGGVFEPVFVAKGTSSSNFLYGVNANATIASTLNSSAFQSLYGGYFNAGVGSSVPASTSVGNVIGVRSNVTVQSGTINPAAASYSASPVFGSTSGPTNLVIPNYYGLILNPPTFTNGARITNDWGIVQQDTSATSYLLGKVGIGTTSPGATLEVDGNVKLTANSGASVTFQDGTSQTTAWTGVLCGGDYAESVDVTGKRNAYEPGDVLVIDPNAPGRFLKSAEAYSTSVTGIYSTKPGATGRRQKTLESSNEVPMAMIGIVPTKVSAENGPIHAGDLLVTSSTIGYAMKGTDRSRLTGAVIGKALGNLNSGKSVIEVVVTLQ